MMNTSPHAFLYTVGHSIRPIEEFIRILQNYVILSLVDVRKIPRSGRNPQYHGDALAQSLRAVGIDYSHRPELGGLRKPVADSINTGWKNDAFRGYADYMHTPEFEKAADMLVQEAGRRATAIMCAEAYWKKCHRMLLSDAMTVRGVDIIHLIELDRVELHKLTPFARVKGKRITYGHAIQPGLFD